jgi:hypothetical protein
MRQILVDRARRRQARRRGGGWQQTTLGDAASPQPVSPEELIALDEALDRLGAFDRRLRDVVEYRYFGGLTDAEVAEALGVTERTVQRDWKRAARCCTLICTLTVPRTRTHEQRSASARSRSSSRPASEAEPSGRWLERSLRRGCGTAGTGGATAAR